MISLKRLRSMKLNKKKSSGSTGQPKFKKREDKSGNKKKLKERNKSWKKRQLDRERTKKERIKTTKLETEKNQHLKEKESTKTRRKSTYVLSWLTIAKDWFPQTRRHKLHQKRKQTLNKTLKTQNGQKDLKSLNPRKPETNNKSKMPNKPTGKNRRANKSKLQHPPTLSITNSLLNSISIQPTFYHPQNPKSSKKSSKIWKTS